MIERADDRTPDSGHPVTEETSPLTARDAARLLGVNERTVRRAIARGELRATKHAGVFRIERHDLSRYRPRKEPVPHRPKGRRQQLRLLPTAPALAPFNVPEPRSSLIGREHETRSIRDMVLSAETPLVTLIGPGGVGKTRLALEIAGQARDAFIDGIWFVDLSPIRDPELVPGAIAGVLGIREAAGVPVTDRLRGYLERRRTLILLDNFEQVVSAGPDIATLLSFCPGLTMLVTSRVPLHLADEHRFPVPPLAVPDTTHVPSFAKVQLSAAVQLFCRKAHAVRPDFELTEANAQAVSEVCVRLDGLPLAIELAAARVNILAPEALLARLEHRLSILTGGSRDVPARLRSMRDAIGWSYDLLDETEQRLFRRLAVFAGGFTEEAASIVAGQERSGSMLDRLASLVEKGLFFTRDTPGDEPRFAMLETIREFGVEQLAGSKEAHDTRATHAAWCLDLALNASPYWFTSEQKRLSDQLEREHDNLRAAFEWLANADDRQAVVRLAGSIWPFWFVRCHWAEGTAWLQWALAWSDGDRTIERSNESACSAGRAACG
ncbi:MAG: helix-turn-helix domain-containing protein [Chloroflexia bacterium]|nr:helix-turn-helix domain-containing protein [Chloroflexia bacterium]